MIFFNILTLLSNEKITLGGDANTAYAGCSKLEPTIFCPAADTRGRGKANI